MKVKFFQIIKKKFDQYFKFCWCEACLHKYFALIILKNDHFELCQSKCSFILIFTFSRFILSLIDLMDLFIDCFFLFYFFSVVFGIWKCLVIFIWKRVWNHGTKGHVILLWNHTLPLFFTAISAFLLFKIYETVCEGFPVWTKYLSSKI